MIIAGFQKTSFVDYPGNICATIFTAGCNMRCPYCHNAKLVSFRQDVTFPEEDILAHLEEKKHLLDGICITGGEPTLQKDLLDFIKKVKAIGLKIKLDSNGSNPDVLRKCIPYVDFIAMDIKQLPSKYQKTAGTAILAKVIEDSINLIKSSGVDYEFRTTVVPQFTNKEDILNIAEYLKGSKKYALQQFVPSSGMFDLNLKEKYSTKELKELGEKIKNNFDEIEVRV